MSAEQKSETRERELMADSSAAQLKLLAEGSSAPVSIPIFDGYSDHWSMLMENFLRQRKL